MILLNTVFHSRPYAFIFRLLLTASCRGSWALPLSLLWLLRQIFLLAIPTLCCAVSLMHLLFLFLPLIICSGFQPLCDSIHRTKRLPLHLSLFILLWCWIEFCSASVKKARFVIIVIISILNHPEHNCNLFPKFIKILYNQKLFTKPFLLLFFCWRKWGKCRYVCIQNAYRHFSLVPWEPLRRYRVAN